MIGAALLGGLVTPFLGAALWGWLLGDRIQRFYPANIVIGALAFAVFLLVAFTVSATGGLIVLWLSGLLSGIGLLSPRKKRTS